jgi:hypothetical protein
MNVDMSGTTLSGALDTCVLECYATSEDIQITLSPLLLAIAEKICHICRFIESNTWNAGKQTTQGSQSFES